MGIGRNRRGEGREGDVSCIERGQIDHSEDIEPGISAGVDGGQTYHWEVLQTIPKVTIFNCFLWIFKIFRAFKALKEPILTIWMISNRAYLKEMKEGRDTIRKKHTFGQKSQF